MEEHILVCKDHQYYIEGPSVDDGPMSALQAIRTMRTMGVSFAEAKTLREASILSPVTFYGGSKDLVYASAERAITKALGDERFPPLQRTTSYMIAGVRRNLPPIVLNGTYPTSEAALAAGSKMFEGHPRIIGLVAVEIVTHQGHTLGYQRQDMT